MGGYLGGILDTAFKASSQNCYLTMNNRTVSSSTKPVYSYNNFIKAIYEYYLFINRFVGKRA